MHVKYVRFPLDSVMGEIFVLEWKMYVENRRRCVCDREVQKFLKSVQFGLKTDFYVFMLLVRG